jgi:hypothetical protein
MKITDTTESIRQHQAGEFKRPEDGKAPFAHVNGQKLANAAEQEKRSVYVDNKNVTDFEEVGTPDFPRIFDSSAGMKFTIESEGDHQKNERIYRQYDKNGKELTVIGKEELIDEWV